MMKKILMSLDSVKNFKAVRLKEEFCSSLVHQEGNLVPRKRNFILRKLPMHDIFKDCQLRFPL